MTTPLVPREVYLLERYSSLEYFSPIRDQWEAMVKHVERCLDVFMERLPPDYRNRKQPYQPDIVWGERVLPNFRDTLQVLDRAHISLKHGDLNALGAANGVTGDLRGQSVDYSVDWMGEPQVTAVISDALNRYWELIHAPQQRASNIVATHGRHWDPTDLTYRYDAGPRGPLDPPERWPRYRLNSSVRVEQGGVVTRSGIYLPDIDNSCAALLIEGANRDDAIIMTGLSDPVTEDGEKLYKHPLPVTEWRSTGWTLIERVPDSYVDDGLENLLGGQAARPTRLPGGQPCPRTGWWSTPARVGSRRYFKQGEVFPIFEAADYGETLWQWDTNQSGPKL